MSSTGSSAEGPTRTLMVMRHAKSAWPGATPDIERPLTERGRADAAAGGRWLAERGIRLELVLVSPAARTQETWNRVSAKLPDAPEARTVHDLYAASWWQLLEVLRDVDDGVRSVGIVSHNPGSHRLASELSGDGSDQEALDRMAAKYPTLGTSILQFDGSWEELRPGICALTDFVAPRG